ncbi:MAG: helix-hairpin-helix domain-containing protein [Nitrospira sp.]|nr:helix-hairpin-helix domain-containing protein [Nitrospira sp.]MBH0180873.1 helix-hairpin-helix domain-containing protein [Nitrospira sp.]MBH0186756.1 helix-hairpin-helix domain-containing protein [Nitrospira sp.]
MIRSLLLKLGMLAVTIGVVFWIGWQTPDFSLKHAALEDDLKAAPVDSPVTFESEPGLPDRSHQKTTAEQSGASHAASHANVAAQPHVVDLNSATAQELESLPGIGAVIAERVIAYRQSVGRFRTIEDLREVAGIGSKRFDRLKPLVTVAAVETKRKQEKRPL